MALRIPQRTAQRVPLAEALDRICAAAPELDASDVAVALLDAIQQRRLKVQGVPEPLFSMWLDAPFLNWPEGWFSMDGAHVPVTLKRYYTPTVLLAEAIALFDDSAAETSKVTKRTGPVPVKKTAVKERMLTALKAGRNMSSWTMDALTAEFGNGVSRTVCMEAWKEALSEFAANNSGELR